MKGNRMDGWMNEDFFKKNSSPTCNLCELVDDKWMRKEKQQNNTMNELKNFLK
jgi:hypothetical protein